MSKVKLCKSEKYIGPNTTAIKIISFGYKNSRFFPEKFQSLSLAASLKLETLTSVTWQNLYPSCISLNELSKDDPKERKRRTKKAKQMNLPGRVFLVYDKRIKKDTA